MTKLLEHRNCGHDSPCHFLSLNCSIRCVGTRPCLHRHTHTRIYRLLNVCSRCTQTSQVHHVYIVPLNLASHMISIAGRYFRSATLLLLVRCPHGESAEGSQNFLVRKSGEAYGNFRGFARREMVGVRGQRRSVVLPLVDTDFFYTNA